MKKILFLMVLGISGGSIFGDPWAIAPWSIDVAWDRALDDMTWQLHLEGDMAWYQQQMHMEEARQRQAAFEEKIQEILQNAIYVDLMAQAQALIDLRAQYGNRAIILPADPMGIGVRFQNLTHNINRLRDILKRFVQNWLHIDSDVVWRTIEIILRQYQPTVNDLREVQNYILNEAIRDGVGAMPDNLNQLNLQRIVPLATQWMEGIEEFQRIWQQLSALEDANDTGVLQEIEENLNEQKKAVEAVLNELYAIFYPDEPIPFEDSIEEVSTEDSSDAGSSRDKDLSPPNNSDQDSSEDA